MPSCRDRDAAMRWPRCAARARRAAKNAGFGLCTLHNLFWCVKHSSCVCHNEHRFARSSPLVVYPNKETNNILICFLIHNPRSHAPPAPQNLPPDRRRQISSHFFRSEDHTNLFVQSIQTMSTGDYKGMSDKHHSPPFTYESLLISCAIVWTSRDQRHIL